VRALSNPSAGFLGGSLGVEPNDLSARGHQGLHATVAQAKDGPYHLMFGGLEHPSLYALLEHGMNLSLRHRRFGSGADPQEAEDRVG
jgi:hypothetical protein